MCVSISLSSGYYQAVAAYSDCHTIKRLPHTVTVSLSSGCRIQWLFKPKKQIPLTYEKDCQYYPIKHSPSPSRPKSCSRVLFLFFDLWECVSVSPYQAVTFPFTPLQTKVLLEGYASDILQKVLSKKVLLSLSPPPPAGPHGEGEGHLRIGTKICFIVLFFLFFLLPDRTIWKGRGEHSDRYKEFFCFYFFLPAGLDCMERIGTKNLSSVHFLPQVLYWS